MRVSTLLLVVMGSLGGSACGDDVAPSADAGARDPDAGARDGAVDGPDADSVDAGGPGDAGEVIVTGRWLEDVTAAAGISFERVGMDAYESIPDRMSGGVCVLDVDGAGPMDLFFALRGESRLYVASELLAYTDETDARGLGDVGDAMGCLAFDADQDGDADLLVTAVGELRLYANDGGSFVDASARLVTSVGAHDMLMGVSAGDIDGDGDLDLLVSGFLDFDPLRHAPETPCGPTACVTTLPEYDFVRDHLLEQGADGVFRDVTAARAPDLLAPEPGLVSVIRDLTGDAEPELYVGNDIGSTFVDRVLSRDGSGRYVDVGESIGMAYDWRGYGIDTMGFASGDLNGDGMVDHVVTSFETDGSAVFVGREGGRYEDWAIPLGVEALADTFRWGVALVDLDVDGDLDVFEATGHFHTDDEVARIGYRGARDQAPNLMMNLGDGTLRAVAGPDGDGLRVARSARGLALTDLDDDGRPDLVLAPALGAPALLLNVREPAGSYLTVRLEGRAPNRDAIGARVTVRQSGRAFVRERWLGEGYLGSSDPRLFFGLPDAEPAEVEVRWPSSTVTNRGSVAVGREVVIDEI